jgi:hypothetical protein
MADVEITDLTLIGTPVAADLLEIVDVSDTTDSAAGSSRKVTVEQLHAGYVDIRTAAAWASANPVLAAGVQGVESDTGIVRMGDGTTDYLDLSAGMQICKQTSSVTNSTVAASSDIPGMAFTVQAGHTYMGEWRVGHIADNTATGVLFVGTGPTMVANGSWWSARIQATGSAGTAVFWESVASAFGTTLTNSTAATPSSLTSTFGSIVIFQVQPTVDGVIQLKFRTETDTSVVTMRQVGTGWMLDMGLV